MASEVNKEAFVELQGQLVDTASKLKQVQMQMRVKESEKKRASLTLDELQSLPPDTRTYLSVGKMFILDNIADLMELQESKCQECDSSLATLQTSKEYLERQMKELEINFRELMQQTPALARQVMAMSMS
eukprot:TRINITY_DN9047_c0_g1_i3.p1 TRINITY_DN9047_c0_g1~~TRINITY_DN9047_c0_g1_i3.p1  ORF type:complete len:150 (-),score=34.64 TRINITY_DN9047_c0_g1_i3:326-715(-)